MASLALSLVDPALVDLHRIYANTECAILQNLTHNWSQYLPQGILATSMTIETHQHLYDCGVPRHYLLRLVHLQSISREK